MSDEAEALEPRIKAELFFDFEQELPRLLKIIGWGGLVEVERSFLVLLTTFQLNLWQVYAQKIVDIPSQKGGKPFIYKAWRDMDTSRLTCLVCEKDAHYTCNGRLFCGQKCAVVGWNKN